MHCQSSRHPSNVSAHSRGPVPLESINAISSSSILALAAGGFDAPLLAAFPGPAITMDGSTMVWTVGFSEGCVVVELDGLAEDSGLVMTSAVFLFFFFFLMGVACEAASTLGVLLGLAPKMSSISAFEDLVIATGAALEFDPAEGAFGMVERQCVG